MLMFVIPFLFQIALIVSLVVTFVTEQKPDLMSIFNGLQLIPLVVMLYLSMQFGWYYSVTTSLHKMLPGDIKLNMTRFKIFFFIPFIYFNAILLFVFFLIQNMKDTGEAPVPNVDMILSAYAMIIPLHLFSIFCSFHSIYHTAKTIKSAEQKKEVKFQEFGTEFVLLWFFPIGIWFLQPRINKLYTEQEYNSKPNF